MELRPEVEALGVDTVVGVVDVAIEVVTGIRSLPGFGTLGGGTII